MIVIDLEASSLDNGFPVSVGIVSSDGRMFYAVIKPHSDWSTGYRWSHQAERIHGFSRDHLAAHGWDAAAVVNDIRAMFGDEEFTSDAPWHDASWFNDLIRVSGIAYTPQRHRETTRVRLETLFDELDVSSKARRAIIDMRHEMRTHHALSDAASSIAVEQAARAWVDSKELRACRAVFEGWKKRVKIIAIGVEQMAKYSDALSELSKR
jgi:hypothetical protein